MGRGQYWSLDRRASSSQTRTGRGTASWEKEEQAKAPHSKDELGRLREPGRSLRGLGNRGTLSLGHSNPGPTLGQTRLPGFGRNPVARKKRTEEA